MVGGDGVLAVTHTLGLQQTLRSPLLAGFELEMDDIFLQQGVRAVERCSLRKARTARSPV